MQPQANPPPDPQDAEIHTFIKRLYAGCPRVLVTPALLGINLLVFAFLLSKGAGFMGEQVSVYIEWGANYAPLTRDGAWWRLLSAMFLHFGIIHLAFNMWALWEAGRLTERLYGHRDFFWLYFTAGLSGSLASLLWNPEHAVSAGASGAVFGVFGALVAYLLIQRHTVPARILRNLMRSALFFMGYSLFIGLARTGIDNAAHVGGLLAGLLLGLLLARPLGSRYHNSLRTALTYIGTVLAIALTIHLIPPPEFNFQAQRQAEEQIRQFLLEEGRLMDSWRNVMAKLQQEGADPGELAEDLRTDLAEWRQLGNQLQEEGGDIAENTARIRWLLSDYADLRAQSIHHFIRFLETGSPESKDSFAQRTMEIQAVLQQINQSKAPPEEDKP